MSEPTIAAFRGDQDTRWLVGGLVGNIPQFAFAQDCQQRSRHHFFTVYFGPLQAMTQDPQVNILLFVRLSCGMGHGGTWREIGTWIVVGTCREMQRSEQPLRPASLTSPHAAFPFFLSNLASRLQNYTFGFEIFGNICSLKEKQSD